MQQNRSPEAQRDARRRREVCLRCFPATLTWRTRRRTHPSTIETAEDKSLQCDSQARKRSVRVQSTRETARRSVPPLACTSATVTENPTRRPPRARVQTATGKRTAAPRAHRMRERCRSTEHRLLGGGPDRRCYRKWRWRRWKKEEKTTTTTTTKRRKKRSETGPSSLALLCW